MTVIWNQLLMSSLLKHSSCMKKKSRYDPPTLFHLCTITYLISVIYCYGFPYNFSMPQAGFKGSNHCNSPNNWNPSADEYIRGRKQRHPHS